MRSYCAFLRGVNVGGKRLKMLDVVQVFQTSGVKNVTYVLASGNLLFQSSQPPSELRPLLEEALGKHYKDEFHLFIKSKEEIQEILSFVPYEEDPDVHLYAFLCERGFEQRPLEEFEKKEAMEGEEARIHRGYFYWKCPKNQTLTSDFSKILGRKSLRDSFTSRNLATIKKISRKLDSLDK